MSDNRSQRAAFIAYMIIVLLWLFLKVPLLADFPRDSGLGAQLAGADQILRGDHPHVDFRISYGPLVFYLCAFAQALFGGRILGEWALDIVGYAIAFAGLFTLIARTRLPTPASFGLALLAALSMSRIWKYFMVLAPVLTLLAAWKYFDRPDRRSLVLLAASVAFAGLLRHDFGAYTFTCAAVAVAYTASCKRPGRVVHDLLALVGWVFTAASPFLAWALSQGSLFTYLSDSVRVTLAKSAGLSLPFPAFNWTGPLTAAPNEISWLYVFFFAQPVIGAVLFVATRSAMSDAGRLRWLTTWTLATLCLVQATHRSDFHHLLQAIPINFVLIALIIQSLRAEAAGNVLRASFVTWSVLAAVSTLLLLKNEPWPELAAREHLAKLPVYTQKLDPFLADYQELYPRNALVHVAKEVRRCTQEDERIVVLPWSPGMYYLAGRRLGPGMMFSAPGYFDASDYQEWSVEKVEAQKPVLFVDKPGFSYDGKPERAFQRTHPILWEHLQRSYEPIFEVEKFRVSTRRDLDPERLANLKACLT